MTRPYAEFDPAARPASGPEAAGGLRVRLAEPRDATALGRISAERAGGVPAEYAARFERWIRGGADSEIALVLAAEVAEGLVGFGNVQHFVPPPDAPAHAAPAGWYLAGLVVDPAHRRRGIGKRLTEERLDWIARRARRAYYFSNARNLVSIELHRRLGFVERTRDFWHPSARFEGGVGILFEKALPPPPIGV